jgi:RHS repeat-associated protein
VFITNGVAVSSLPRTISQYFDPSARFLELGETDGGVTTWKLYGPDLNGFYGGMQGVGGLEAVVNAPSPASPVVSDIRGNGYAIYNINQGSLTWYSSRVTAYGAVEGYRPLPLADGATMAPASAWRGKWADVTGLYWLGKRYYDPVAGNWLSADPLGHDADPSLYAFCAAGDPVNDFDSDGGLAAQGAAGENGGSSWLPLFGNGLNNTVSGIGQSMGQGLYDLYNGIGYATGLGTESGYSWQGSLETYGQIYEQMYSMATPENPAATPYVEAGPAVSAAAVSIAGAAGAWEAAGLPTMNVAVGAGDLATSPIHVAYGVGDTWVNAVGANLGNLTVSQAFAAENAEGAYFTITGIPIVNSAAVTATGGAAWTCVTAAGSAFLRAWLP